MIIEGEKDLTSAVLREYQRIKNPRLREIVAALVRHLHAFARDVKLTEQEFHAAMAYIVAIGKQSNETHNEAVLMAGSLGLSSLICLLNNGDNGHDRDRREHARAVLAHGLAADQERRVLSCVPRRRGRSCSSTPLFTIRDGKPIEGAEVDIWQSSPEGFYENQDPLQADMNLRGQFITDQSGHISFRSVKPAGYPIPIDGPVGELLRTAGRHNMRPSHLHFLVYKPGFKTLISQIYDPEDKNIESDVQFGVTRKSDRRIYPARRCVQIRRRRDTAMVFA